MKEFLLGVRLLLGAGRGSRVRFLLMVVGSAIGVCCLAAVLAIPGILEAQDGRKAARVPDCKREVGGVKCVVTEVSVSPSHVPVVNPPCECGAYFDGCGRPSIQMIVSSRSPQPAIFHASSFCVTGSRTGEISSANGPEIA